MWAEIDRLAGDEQITVLLTTHYLDEADRLADRLAIIDGGTGRGRGDAGGAQERTARRHRPRRAARGRPSARPTSLERVCRACAR